MKLALPFPSPRHLAAASLALCLFGFTATSRAVDATNEIGVRLLEAELAPAKVTLLKAKCDQLVIAVSKTTLAHPRDAVVILHAALARQIKKMRKDDDLATLPCTCARRIFLASLAASPKRSSELFDLATELYPDCTPEFADALRGFGASQSGQSTSGDGTSAGSPAFSVPMGTSDVDPLNPASGDGGFGVGFGPGFPGSPGFTGSGPGGGLALPPVAVTTVVNG